MKNVKLTKKMLDSITPNTIDNYRKVKVILANMDISEFTLGYHELVKEGIAARELGLTWKRVKKLLKERVYQ